MTSATPMQVGNEQESREKGIWIDPSVERLDLSEAEGADGSGPEGGQFLS
jgi:hypothetical protein